MTLNIDEVQLDTEGSPGKDWTEDELRESVIAYLKMLECERTGVKFTKKKIYDDLANKYGRTARAFSFRMQNISYVFSLMGRKWVSGLKPAKNVGANVGAQIERLIMQVEGSYALPVVAFEIAVSEDMQKKYLPEPKGAMNPAKRNVTVTQHDRDEKVRAWVLSNSKGICECCDKPAPFKRSDGINYLEVHHVKMLADSGPDNIENAVAVCPNCHCELHYGENAKELVGKLYQKVARLKQFWTVPTL